MSLGDLDRTVLRLARTRGHSRWAQRVIGAYSCTGEHAAVWLGLRALGYATSSAHTTTSFAPADVLAGALLGTAVAEAWPA